MTFLIAVICLLAGLGAGIFALRPQAMQSLDVAVDMSSGTGAENFTLSRSILLIGPEVNEPVCKAQRREIKRILQPLLQAGFKIIEIYGDQPPAENGEVYEWLDSQLMRRTLNAEEGFHLIHVNREGQTSFHSGRVINAEALLHIFDLWEFISEDGEIAPPQTEATLAKPIAAPIAVEAEAPARPQSEPEPVLHESELQETEPALIAEPEFAPVDVPTAPIESQEATLGDASEDRIEPTFSDTVSDFDQDYPDYDDDDDELIANAFHDEDIDDDLSDDIMKPIVEQAPSVFTPSSSPHPAQSQTVSDDELKNDDDDRAETRLTKQEALLIKTLEEARQIAIQNMARAEATRPKTEPTQEPLPELTATEPTPIPKQTPLTKPMPKRAPNAISAAIKKRQPPAAE